MDDAERAELRRLLRHGGGVATGDSSDALLRLSMRGCVVRRTLPGRGGLLHELTAKGRAVARSAVPSGRHIASPDRA
jgi:hypothetical protein